MDNYFKMIFSFLVLCLIISYSSAHAQLELKFNIIPKDKSESVIDTNSQKELVFNLFEEQGNVYYEGKKLDIKDKSFKIDCSRLQGYKTIIFTNDDNEIATFKYHFSDSNGKLDNEYVLVNGKELESYVTTYNNIKIIYSSKEIEALKSLKENISKLPEKVISNVKTIKMVPYSTTTNIAGTTKDSNITLYNYKKYVDSTRKNIIYHEIAHTFASKLIDQKIMDYSYTNYAEAVLKDMNFVSNYSMNFTKHNGKYSEDFADSFAFYFINKTSFKNKFANRSLYIESLI